MTAEPTKTTTLAERSPPEGDPHALRMAFREGNGPGVERMLLERFGGDRTGALRAAIQMAMDLRRQDVACLGSQEAFVRHGPDGSLEQVVAPVRLSLADKTLYQIPKWSQGPDGQWGERIENPDQALVSYQGLLRINQVAGCAVGMPSTVWVDGEERMNPWREPDENGDTRRVIVAVNCVGPAPMTGALVVVQYTLEVQPSHDFAHMLLGLTSGKKAIPDHVYLIDREEWLAKADSERRGWKWAPLYAGVGIAHDLRQPRVLEVYRKQVGLLQNVLKKAQTVARRNAMKSHPALAFHAVRVKDGDAVVRGVGWAARGDGMGRYLRLHGGPSCRSRPCRRSSGTPIWTCRSWRRCSRDSSGSTATCGGRCEQAVRAHHERDLLGVGMRALHAPRLRVASSSVPGSGSVCGRATG